MVALFKDKYNFDFKKIKNDFPIFLNLIDEKPLVFLDSAASSQKPRQVIEGISKVYEHHYSNIHRGVYKLSQESTKLYEDARVKVSHFIGASSPEEIIFTRGATEGINLIASAWGGKHLAEGDEILLTTLEHHSNIVPWQILSKNNKTVIKEVKPDRDGNITIDKILSCVTNKTKIIALTHVSNTIGTVLPISEICKEARERGIITLVDGCQAIPHISVNVRELDCDFYVFSGHKIYGPSGIGVLYGKKDLLNASDPYQGGGDMIETVSIQSSTYADLPNKFEAGTPNIVGAIGLGVALDYVSSIGMNNISSHSQNTLRYGLDLLNKTEGIKIIGNPSHRLGVISFLYFDIHPHDLGTILDSEGLCLRAGHHCAQPTMSFFKVTATLRASVGIYNQKEDFNTLVTALERAREIFKK